MIRMMVMFMIVMRMMIMFMIVMGMMIMFMMVMGMMIMFMIVMGMMLMTTITKKFPCSLAVSLVFTKSHFSQKCFCWKCKKNTFLSSD